MVSHMNTWHGLIYTVLQKKRNFSEPIFPDDPGSLTLTRVMYTTKCIYLHSPQKEMQLSMLRFFWRRVYGS